MEINDTENIENNKIKKGRKNDPIRNYFVQKIIYYAVI